MLLTLVVVAPRGMMAGGGPSAVALEVAGTAMGGKLKGQLSVGVERGLANLACVVDCVVCGLCCGGTACGYGQDGQQESGDAVTA